MIAIVAPKRKDNKTSFSDLINYLLRKHKSKSTSVPEHNLLNSTTSGIYNGISFEHNCISLETAAIEMASIALNNTKVKDPVYHLVISWSSSDKPTKKQIFDSAKETIKSLGFTDHQYVTVIHEDTDNIHCHIAANRVGLESNKAIDLWYDMERLDKKMRELEIKFGFKKDNGIYDVVNNEIVKVDKKVHKKNNGINRMELYSNEESFLSFLETNIKPTLKKLLKNSNPSWNVIHKFLMQNNVILEKKGQGIVFKELNSNLTVKGSSLGQGFSLAKLQDKLGLFVELNLTDTDLNDINVSIPNVTLKKLKRNAQNREIRRNKRIRDREALKTEYRAYRASFTYLRLDKEYCKSLYKTIMAEKREKMLFVRQNVPSVIERKVMYSQIAFETLQKKAQLQLRLTEERKNLNADNKNKRLNYNDWVNVKAQEGSEPAKAQIRGWHYSEQRKNPRQKN